MQQAAPASRPDLRPSAVQTTAAPAVQPAAPTGFEGYKRVLAARALREGVRPQTVQNYVYSTRLNQRAIDLDKGPQNISYSNTISPFAPYRREHVTPSLIARGQDRYSRYYQHLTAMQARYGVDPAVMMAIYGHETSYGSFTGGFDLLDVLASLAYDGRRRELFESEFVGALKLLDIGVGRGRLKGSYAGATGYPQFMPTVALRLRADGDGDGYADLWNNEEDGLASIGNYLRDAGWKPNVPWGVAVQVPATLNRAAIRSTLRPQRCPRVYQRHSRWLTMREWRGLGLLPVRATLPDNELATLIEPDGPGQTAYLLTTNYRAILDYNCSNFYALSVGLLADAIARR
ncbi:lytic murein transglycosylase [Sphingomonas piscis]|uniref:Lytic murein transglycosylase n=2 Tax=Sphingomonas piscis TaxID=2714943 RepID=A0A6G7YSX7_9SPHN|nr:lytic murein transglycosylase [Sphingomonas piscis]